MKGKMAFHAFTAKTPLCINFNINCKVKKKDERFDRTDHYFQFSGELKN